MKRKRLILWAFIVAATITYGCGFSRSGWAQDPVPALVARVSELTPENPATKTATELGCRVNDKTFDNSTVLQPAIAAGYHVHLDQTGIYYASSLTIPQGMSCVITGVSAGRRFNPKAATCLAPFAPNQTHILEIAGGESAKGAGKQIRIERIAFVGTATCDGLRAYSGDVVTIRDCAAFDCRRGITIEYKSRLCSPRIENIYTHNCDTGVLVIGGTTTSALSISGGSIDQGRIGVSIASWGGRGCSIIGLTAQAQTEASFKFRRSNAVLIGTYTEPADGGKGISAEKGSVVSCYGASNTTYANHTDSKITSDAASSIGYSVGP